MLHPVLPEELNRDTLEEQLVGRCLVCIPIEGWFRRQRRCPRAPQQRYGGRDRRRSGLVRQHEMLVGNAEPRGGCQPAKQSAARPRGPAAG